jgi:L-lactate dehydrogenase complex protein LldG
MSAPLPAPRQSRQRILDRIGDATKPVKRDASLLEDAYGTLPRAYLRRGALSAAARIALMIERLREYDAEVVESSPESLPVAIAAQLTASGKHIFAAPQGLPAEWLAGGFDWKIDRGLDIAEIEKAEGVVTAASCGVADSGTIVLHHSPAEGRRVLTLLPDWHLCILRASQVVETLPEYFDRCQPPPALHPSDKDPSLGTPAVATTISGPSATADIEMTRIKGVHGPRFLHVILVHDDLQSATNVELRPAKTGSKRGKRQ